MEIYFINHTINKPYRYENMTLGDLKDKLMAQEGITFADIFKGYHVKNENLHLKYDYDNEPVSPEVIDEIKHIIVKHTMNYVHAYEQFCEALYSEVVEKFEPRYEKEALSKKEKLRKDYPTFESYLKAEPYKQGYYKNSKKVNEWVRGDFYDEICDYMTSRFKDAETLRTEEKIQMEKEIVEKYPKFRIWSENLNFLPSSINFSHKPMASFENIAKQETEIVIGDLLPAFYDIYEKAHIPTDVKNRIKGFSFRDVYTVPVKGNYTLYSVLEPERAKEVFDKGVEKALADVANEEWNKDRFFYELDNSPVTVNINTKTGKTELIDGYKRVLVNMSEDCMKLNMPVRVFEDLDDKDFIALLYTSNYWKQCKRRDYISFYDRGFLFALKQRFGFEISVQTFEKHHDNSEAFHYFELYDNVTVDDFFNHLTDKPFYMDDISLFYGEDFDAELQKNHGYNPKYFNTLVSDRIVSVVAKLRRSGETKRALTMDIVKSIYEDKAVCDAFKGKNYSSMTYARNRFYDYGVDKRIEELLADALTKEVERNKVRTLHSEEEQR